MVILTNRNFDYVVGKANYYIRVTSTSVCLVSKEGHSMDCYRDPHQLMYALKYMACTFSVSSISSLGKAMWFYQLLHANMNATDEYGRPAPTLYMLNPDATMEVFVRFGIDCDPQIQVRKFQGAAKHDEQVHIPFTTLNYNRLKGSTLCRKMDNLFAAFRDIDE